MQSIKDTTDNIQKERDTIKDDMEVDTEANEPYEEYVKQVKLKTIEVKREITVIVKG